MEKVYRSKYFYGTEVSKEGQRVGYLDYMTLASAFPHILNNEIINHLNPDYLHPYNTPEIDEDDDYYPEIYQWFIVNEFGAETISEFTDDLVYYDEELDLYLWGVSHFGTGWDYVMTPTKLELKEG